MPRSVKYGLIGLAALIALVAVWPTLQVLFIFHILGRLFNLTIPERDLTEVSVVEWLGQRPMGEVTLFLTQTDKDGREARVITDPQIIFDPESRFGYFETVFENWSPGPSYAACRPTAEQRGKIIALVVAGDILAERAYCRPTALNFRTLWRKATPVTLREEVLTREAHRVRVAEITRDPQRRVIRAPDTYGAYDQTYHIPLPTIWAEGPYAVGTGALTKRLDRMLAPFGDGATGWFRSDDTRPSVSGTQIMIEGGDVPVWQKRLVIDGPEGLRDLREFTMERHVLEIACIQTVCDRIAALDFMTLTLRDRDADLLHRAYNAAPPASGSEAREGGISLSDLLQETPGPVTATPITYALTWIGLPEGAQN
ncbi:MAG: hypothetical protein EP336_07930 [Rhodobacteraceae bacterium]|nr:MAG: hypothetical protein EP336_07930 [Paracoccaceae bacterium]